MDNYDVIVIGGGPAGLQAALTLGRVHRHALLLDSGSYRNAGADHLHNFLTRDGTSPADFRKLAREELAGYPTVEVRDVAADHVAADGDGFVVEVGGRDLRSRGIVLATGLRDTLPDKPGLAELFGTAVAHCPFCHGHEYAGRPVAILGAGPRAEHLLAIMGPVASRLTVLADGAEPEVELPDGVARAPGAGHRPVPQPVRRHGLLRRRPR